MEPSSNMIGRGVRRPPFTFDESIGPIVERICDGDHSSRRTLYELTCDRVFRHVYRIVGAQDAHDVTQQVYLQVFQKLDSFRARSQFTTWLYRVATNEALQHIRRERKHRHLQMNSEYPDQRHNEDDIVAEKELMEVALAKLDPELRALFLLREVERFSYRKIAEVTDIPEGTVASRLNRARDELRKHLQALGWEALP